MNKKRRYFLIGATSAVAGVGVVGAAVPFVKFWSPSAKARAAGAPVKIDFSKLQEGEMLSPIPAWRGKPIFLLYRTAEAVSALERSDLDLADANSDNPEMQPEYAKNVTRSTRPEIGVYVGICTHLGCSPKLETLVAPGNFGEGQGGFFCPCHGSRFDLAGRVGAGFPAPDNLEVPPYRFESETVIVIGDEGGAA
ncbi:MAG: ubiquinol-cytochrome c reductase iron-sulfur subunit [Pseudomonadales bacterium]|nr:ubiquinol-cytochrome c reductase iron-sulfur subunit [Pseudomonadales bacterium]